MTSEFQALAVTAASVGLLHTLAGPDHYLPFIVISKAKKWSVRKTLGIAFLCGIGHVMSSVLLGFAGIFLGVAAIKLGIIESFRGNIAAWALATFGFVYMLWGIWRSIKHRPHTHTHFHENDIEHEHEHTHAMGHAHIHEVHGTNLTPWILFTIFVFGPCEPLIPIIMYPAAQENVTYLVGVVAIFMTVTIGTMLLVVSASSWFLAYLPVKKIERYNHALAGFTICLCGLWALIFP